MTLTQLKRQATNGEIKFELFERFGKTGEEIPERYKGIRTVKKVNSVGITLENIDGLISELRFDSAKLIEYDGKSLIIYDRGERDLTEQEQKILDEWQKIEDNYYENNPYGNVYWKKVDYFKQCSCPYLSGYESVRGKLYQYNGKVLDNQIRGRAILKYHIYHC